MEKRWRDDDEKAIRKRIKKTQQISENVFMEKL